MAGLVAGGLGALAAYSRLVETAEFFCYDKLQQLSLRWAHPPASEPVLMVSIDETSLRRLSDAEPWPWPRSLIGRVVTELKSMGAKVVVLDAFYVDYAVRGAQDELEFVEGLQQAGNAVVAAATGDRNPDIPAGTWAVLLGTFKTRAEAQQSAIPLLAKRLRPYVLPGPKGFELWLGGFRNAPALEEQLSGLVGLGDVELKGEPVVRALTLQEVDTGKLSAESWVAERDAVEVPGLDTAGIHAELGLVLPRPEVAAAVQRVGFANDAARAQDAYYDGDDDDYDRPPLDAEREVRLFVRYGGKLYPSLPLAALLAANPGMKLSVKDGRLQFGSQSVPINKRGYMYVTYPGSTAAFDPDLGSGRKAVAIDAVIHNAVRRHAGQPTDAALEAAVKGKIVVVANRAGALFDQKITPVAELNFGSAVVASALRTLSLGDAVRRAGRELDARWALLMGVLGALYALLTFRYARSDAFLVFTALGMGASVALYAAYALHLLIDDRVWQAVFAPSAAFALAAVSTGWINFGETNADRSRIADALGRFTSPAIVESVLRNPLLIAPKRRELTVLFSDIAGFTGISEGIPAPRLAELLSTYFTEMTLPIAQTQGHVDKFIGDAIMAFWNAPLANERHAALACKAALNMRDRLQKLRPALQKEYGVEVSARIGLNTGEVVVGELGSRGRGQDDKSNYTCIGDAVNLASRLEGVNKQYGTTILCGPRTVELAGEAFVFRELDKVRVKGKQEAVGLYELVAGKNDRLSVEQKSALDRYGHGLAAYRARDFAKALEHFEAVLKLSPADGPAAIFRDRCQAYQKSPPPPGWDGVHDLHEK